MSAVEDSISRLHNVRDSIDDGRSQIISASDELERHQGTIIQASKAIEEASTSTTGAADGLEQLAGATRALSYDSTAQSVENAKERVDHATNHLLTAKEHVEKAAAAVGAARETLGETSGTLTESDTAVDEAINRLSSLHLAGGGATGRDANAAEFLSELRLKLPKNHTRLRSPNRRHRFDNMAKTKHVDDVNTVALPYIDVTADAEAIRSGRALWQEKRGVYHVNGRQYKTECKKGKPTLIPIAGDGLVPLSSGEYKALRGFNIAGGDWEKRPENLVRNPGIKPTDWQKAFVVYELATADEQGERP